MKANTFVVLFAILCITVLECFAMARGVNGATLGIVVTVIAGLGGYHARNVYTQIKGGK